MKKLPSPKPGQPWSPREARERLARQVFINVAREISRLSRCKRAQVGAVIVQGRNLVSYGYNGTPAGFCNTCERLGRTRPEVIHAELNAILKAGPLCQGADLYVTLSPCQECCKLIRQAGIKKVYYLDIYHDTQGLDQLKLDHEQLTL